MENRKRTNLISVLIILLCLSLCVGATYAYFTDSVTSTGNKIQAGNLKIDLELLDKETQEWNSIKTSQAPIFNYNLWEPGYTDVKLLKVENEGNLAIKWEARLVTEGTLNALADEIEVYVTTSNNEMNFPADLDAVKGWTKVGTLRTFFANTGINGTLEATKASYFAIALHLPTTVENTNAQGVELQNLALPEFDIQIVATQYTYESDAFDDQYDAGATFPTNETTTPAPSEPNEPTDDSIFTWLENGDGTYTVTGLKNPRTLTEVNIPSTYKGCPVTGIGEGAFYDDYNVKSITIPEGVTTIGDEAFFYCQVVEKIIIPDSVTSIGDDAFYACWFLKGTEYANARYIGNDSNPYIVLMEATSEEIESCVIHENTKFIYENAFNYCHNLTRIEIPDGVIQIDEFAFFDCSGLTGELKIPSSVKAIGEGAFEACFSLTSITIGKGVTTLGDASFKECLNLKNFVVDIDNTAYQSINGNLYSKDGTVLIAYAAGKSDTNFTVPNEITTIGDEAFYGCSNLTSITIPNGVTTIGYSAFENCTMLQNVTICNSITSIGYNAFGGCDSLVYSEYSNGYYLGNNSNQYVALVKAKSTSIESCVIHENAKIICYSAFQDCTYLTDITIPDSVTTIGASAFAYSGLTSIDIPDNVTSIGNYAFTECYDLASVTFGSGVTTIGFRAFEFCSSLTSIDIPDNITIIDGYAFTDCSNLVSVTFGSGVTTIKESAFACSGLTSIDIPDNVTSIGNYAFTECHDLASVTFGSGVTTIGFRAFEYCSSLTSIDIPGNVSTIDHYAFDSCSNLTSITFDGTVEQWNAIKLGYNWNSDVPATYVQCSDGKVELN